MLFQLLLQVGQFFPGLLEKALSKSRLISVIRWQFCSFVCVIKHIFVSDIHPSLNNIFDKLKLNQVEERAIWVNELMEVDEVFCTGTAVGVASVGSVTYKGRRIEFKVGENTVCQALGSTLVGIQTGLIEDKKGWIFNIR
ncbi:hypothetical protein F3Y22_tig00111210pilonHSYRG00128 [Hibiscus syriacus]|uniref:Uncharacterized protein n=1 Tax=Hibiscus syriacus TaxID=106335 RepID=A0A6A2YVE9_HIBSY|nr:hypothetical protein F3Y22_tig00111210pilonHSYRG00128 [Hibiscus syriacus]